MLSQPRGSSLEGQGTPTTEDRLPDKITATLKKKTERKVARDCSGPDRASFYRLDTFEVGPHKELNFNRRHDIGCRD